MAFTRVHLPTRTISLVTPHELDPSVMANIAYMPLDHYRCLLPARAWNAGCYILGMCACMEQTFVFLCCEDSMTYERA